MKRRFSHKLLALTLALCMCLSLTVPAGASWLDLWGSWYGEAETAAGDTAAYASVSQPFSSGTMNSKYFRIPAIVTLGDGTIVAAADARWNNTADYGGIDTLVAVSSNNGASWTNNWGNYFGDNNQQFNASSCTVMDPALATDGTNVYMLADLFPAGYSAAQQNCLKGNGFDANGHLKLSAGSGGISSTTESNYFYYLGDFDTAIDEAQQRAYIYQNNSTEPVAGYSVDRWFNLYKNDEKVSNLFYAGAEYQAYPAHYLYLVKSEDKGNTWSAPSLINLKADGAEVFFGSCPGGGCVTSTGRIIFPCYDTEKIYGTLQTSVIYSDDYGKSWKRSAGIGDDGTTSEATVSEVELNGEKLLYLFARGSTNYFVSRDNGETWSSAVSTEQSYQTRSAMGSITYSKQINGHPALLLAAPTGKADRTNGKIFVGLVQDDGSIKWDYTYSVNTGGYAYSDMTELADGSIGLLYEDNSGGIVFEKYDIATIADGATIGGDSGSDGTTPDLPDLGGTADEATGVSVTLPAGSSMTVTAGAVVPALEGKCSYKAYDISINGGAYTSSAKVTLPTTGLDTNNKALYGFVVNADGSIMKDTDGVLNSDGTYTFTAPHFSVVGVAEQDVVNAPSNGETNSETITLTVGGTETKKVDGTVTVTAAGDSYIATATTDDTSVGGTAATVTKVTMNEDKTYEKVVLRSGSSNYMTVDSSGNLGVTNDPEKAAKFNVTIKTTYWFYNSASYTIQLNDDSRGLNCSAISDDSGLKIDYDSADWSWSDNYFYIKESGIGGSSYYPTYDGSEWKLSKSSGNSTGLYSVTPGTPGSTTTDITFTGTGEGTTDITVGDTTYTVNVTAPTELVSRNLALNGKLDLSSYSNIKLTSDSSTAGVTLNGSTIQAYSTSGTATVTYDEVNAGGYPTKHYVCTISVSDVIDATVENGPFVGGDDNQKNMAANDSNLQQVPSADQVITKLTISAGLSFNVDLKDGNDAAATWEVEDPAIANVDETGKVTAKAAGSTYLKATIAGVTYRMPVEVLECGELDLRDASSTASGINDGKDSIQHYYITEVTNSRAYYSIAQADINNGKGYTDLEEIFEGNVLYISRPGNFGVTFFGAPNDGYALVAMGSTLSENPKFNALRNSNGEADFSGSDSFYKSGLVTNIKASNNANCTDDQVKTLINAACALRCDGGQGFCGGKHTASGIAFRSEKLPEIKKEVISVAGEPYEEDMTAKVGDQIVFRITITSHSSNITYDPATLTEKTGFSFSDSSLTKSVKDDLATAGEHTYDVTYTVKESDINKMIENTVQLAYTYKSDFSTGSLKASANAAASISAVTLDVDDVVIDFGLPVTCDYSTALNGAGYQFVSGSGSAKYGTVTVTENTVTYTPNSKFVACGTYDTVKFKNNLGGEYTFKVIPASNVLYEENFLTAAEGSGWTHDDSKTPAGKQESQRIGDSGSAFGYDVAYKDATGELGVWKTADNLTPSTGTQALSTSFYGNGFDLIGSCGPTTGRVMLLITNTDTNKLAALKIVDTRFNDASVGGANGMIYQVPLAHVELGSADANYKVEAYASGITASSAASTVSVMNMAGSDAFASILAARGLTMADAEFISFANSAEASAVAETGSSNIQYQDGKYIEIDSFRVYRSSDNSSYPDDERGVTYTNIIDLMDGAVINAYIEAETVSGIAVSEYEAMGGAESEIYLAKNQAISFEIPGYTGDAIQVSLRAVNTSAACNQTAITSNTEMYYEVKQANGLFTIMNTGDGMLAIGNVKLPSGVTASSIKPTSEIEEQVLLTSLAAVFSLSPVEPSEPSEPVKPNFVPEKLKVSDKSASFFSKKIVTLTITTSTDVETLEVNGQYLRPTNAWMVKMGWSSSYTYVLVDTVKKGETASYEITAYNIDGEPYAYYYEA